MGSVGLPDVKYESVRLDRQNRRLESFHRVKDLLDKVEEEVREYFSTLL